MSDASRMALLLAAWWSIADMARDHAGVQDVALAIAREPSIWREMTTRLQKLAIQSLQLRPECALRPETASFIEQVATALLRDERMTSVTT